MSPFSEDGHLHDLGLELLLARAPAADEAAAHVAACQTCQARVAAARAIHAPPRRSPWASPARWFGLVGLGAAAVAAVFLLAPGSEEDALRTKGSAVALEVFRDAQGAASERLRDGDEVHAGDRLGFRVRSRDAGHLLILGTDGGAPYLCYPQGLGGRSAPIAATAAASDVPEAVRMDDKLGEERLVAIVCDAPFEVAQVAGLDAALPPGCRSAAVTLRKVSR